MSLCALHLIKHNESLIINWFYQIVNEIGGQRASVIICHMTTPIYNMHAQNLENVWSSSYILITFDEKPEWSQQVNDSMTVGNRFSYRD